MYTTNSNTLHSQVLRTPFTTTSLFQISPPSQSHLPRLSTILSPIRSSNGQGSREGSRPPPPPPPPITPPDSVEIRFRRGSKKRQRQEEQGFSTEMPKPMAPPKSWDEMSLSEKAIELYMGEKGALFWLNKFAYASIFIIIGGWILFRFVGPALNLYQLDSPPLPPEAMFKGSP